MILIKQAYEPISWKKRMMVGNGLTTSPRGKMQDGNGLKDQCADGNGLTNSFRGKATLLGTKAHLAMVSQTYKCIMVIVCRTHPEKKNMHDG